MLLYPGKISFIELYQPFGKAINSDVLDSPTCNAGLNSFLISYTPLLEDIFSVRNLYTKSPYSGWLSSERAIVIFSIVATFFNESGISTAPNNGLNVIPDLLLPLPICGVISLSSSILEDIRDSFVEKLIV